MWELERLRSASISTVLLAACRVSTASACTSFTKAYVGLSKRWCPVAFSRTSLICSLHNEPGLNLVARLACNNDSGPAMSTGQSQPGPCSNEQPWPPAGILQLLFGVACGLTWTPSTIANQHTSKSPTVSRSVIPLPSHARHRSQACFIVA